MKMDQFTETLDNYVYFVQNRMNEYFASSEFSWNADKIEAMNPGPKFVRVIKVDGLNGGKSVHSFIEITTGDVFKAAGWKAPAKHKRANIYDYESLKRSVGHFGPAYLR
jgi:hypothetical protein